MKYKKRKKTAREDGIKNETNYTAQMKLNADY